MPAKVQLGQVDRMGAVQAGTGADAVPFAIGLRRQRSHVRIVSGAPAIPKALILWINSINQLLRPAALVSSARIKRCVLEWV